MNLRGIEEPIWAAAYVQALSSLSGFDSVAQDNAMEHAEAVANQVIERRRDRQQRLMDRALDPKETP